MTDLVSLYRHRFPEADLPAKYGIWQVLCRDYFQQFVKPDGSLLDLACGYGEFVNNIRAAQKYAVDLNPDSPRFVHPPVTFKGTRADQLDFLPDDTLDTVFTSNFLEHLPDKAALSAVFNEVRRVLKPGGRFLVLGPNIRYLPGAYWDFYDHHLALSHQSLEEGLALHGFQAELVVDRFLPYTTRSALPQAPWLVSLYLKAPPIWKLLGKQFFVVARKAGG